MKTILLVEDDNEVRDAVAELLEDEGYEVYQAENGQVALEVLQGLDHNPLLVLLDLMMPVMSGPQLLAALHANKRLASMPVVVLSAGGQRSDAPGAKEFLPKPFDPQVLLELVDKFCGPPDSH